VSRSGQKALLDDVKAKGQEKHEIKAFAAAAENAVTVLMAAGAPDEPGVGLQTYPMEPFAGTRGSYAEQEAKSDKVMEATMVGKFGRSTAKLES
jgi:hypothetical protein